MSPAPPGCHPLGSQASSVLIAAGSITRSRLRRLDADAAAYAAWVAQGRCRPRRSGSWRRGAGWSASDLCLGRRAACRRGVPDGQHLDRPSFLTGRTTRRRRIRAHLARWAVYLGQWVWPPGYDRQRLGVDRRLVRREPAHSLALLRRRAAGRNRA